ncbi:T9SS type A sorting domain-containing protein [Dyadobacter sp. CY261]|uniref:T9SS type A sorting domain-containing protein n=1 Tax=Dyadobacter sp. CY261 TaxID=2907203 RepID=UPI001F1AD3AB|nr:T9SS type A sorting domain-containing protein [Dyadobacter sp. CY261]MCF0074604.1 T9SS type A sorting domain-containing protein [Dyadobacter sp. CY261]
MQNRYLFLAFVLLTFTSSAQTIYFHQDFSQTTSLINPQPDTGQFSHVILTAPTLSYHKFHKGYMELVRSRQDSATGGIIRAMRATPFAPNPETLFIRIRLSVEGIQSPAVNALYFYVGEDFDPVNNSFPGNALMFAKCSMNFTEDGFTIKDLETQQVSQNYPEKKVVTLIWALNNSDKPLPYRIGSGTPEETVQPGSYDFWVDDEPVCKASAAYPGNSAYSKTKLSNFEMRFRNGVGKIRIDDIRIDNGVPGQVANEVIIAPNPAKRDGIIVGGKGVNMASIRLIDGNGMILPIETMPEAQGHLKVRPLSPLASGIHILQLQNQNGKKQAFKVMVE